ncbi:hypothetical protein ACP3WT_25510, partial [Salmonella enterica]|uniref:hypothetical protein n=1 Tax=Salmonella enterica TaxID=28901 RepID=UPI003CF10AB7
MTTQKVMTRARKRRGKREKREKRMISHQSVIRMLIRMRKSLPINYMMPKKHIGNAFMTVMYMRLAGAIQMESCLEKLKPLTWSL